MLLGVVSDTHGYLNPRVLDLLRGVDHFFIRYEDLVTEPDHMIAELMSWLGLDFVPKQMNWTRRTRHNAHGSEVRFSEEPAINADTAWRTALTWREKAIIWWMSLPTRLPGKAVYEKTWPLWSLGH